MVVVVAAAVEKVMMFVIMLLGCDLHVRIRPCLSWKSLIAIVFASHCDVLPPEIYHRIAPDRHDHQRISPSPSPPQASYSPPSILLSSSHSSSFPCPVVLQTFPPSPTYRFLFPVIFLYLSPPSPPSPISFPPSSPSLHSSSISLSSPISSFFPPQPPPPLPSRYPLPFPLSSHHHHLPLFHLTILFHFLFIPTTSPPLPSHFPPSHHLLFFLFRFPSLDISPPSLTPLLLVFILLILSLLFLEAAFFQSLDTTS